MENQGIINKIKSKYIFKNIFNYNNIQRKLFKYSKYFQNKLNINYIDCKEKYLKNNGFNINEYLYISEEKFEKDILNSKYEKFLLEKKINKKEFENIIYEILENKKKNENDKNFIYIDSPLFNIISKITNFEDKYIIYISEQKIDECNLKNEYIKLLDKLNKSNTKYLSIFYICNNNEIKYIKYIDNKKIKKFILKNNNNLHFLENVNFKELKELNLNSNYILDIEVLKKVRFEKLEILNLGHNNISNNINILENVNFKELKELNLNSNNISDIEVLKRVKFEKLEILNLEENKITNDVNILENVNFKELKN